MIKVLSSTFKRLYLLNVRYPSVMATVPSERGFSVNRQMPEAHGYIICQETLEALRLVKDELNQVSGVFNFDIIRSVLDEAELLLSR